MANSGKGSNEKSPADRLGSIVRAIPHALGSPPLVWLSLKYTVFALLAIAVNLGVQHLISMVYAGFLELYVCLAAGTLAGLIVKYLLDKQYIFYDQTTGLRKMGEKFFIYSAIGGITTLIFWGFEISFDWIFETKRMRYLGGIIGLIIGYWTKYQLDKRIVFLPDSDG